MSSTVLMLLVLGQAPVPVANAIDVTETCWSEGASAVLAADFGGFGGLRGSYRAQSFSFGVDEYGVAPAFGSGFRVVPGWGVPVTSGFRSDFSFGSGFGPRFVSGDDFGPVYGFGSPRIKIKNKVKIRGRWW